MLTFAEELLLLSHDATSGHFRPQIPTPLLNTALAGAALMELAIRDRIDTDLESLTVIDRTPTNDPVLDKVLTEIAAHPGDHTAGQWLDHLRAIGPAIRDIAIARLVARGILRQQDGRLLWVFGVRRYPVMDAQPLQEVEQRITALLQSDDIPDPRDIVIIGLADATGLLQQVLSHEQYEKSRVRIRQIAQLDIIGQATRTLMEDLEAALSSIAAGAGG
jgi:golgi phosphoprotein 3